MTDRAALSNAQSIDIHAHAVLAGSMGTAGRHGPNPNLTYINNTRPDGSANTGEREQSWNTVKIV